MKTPIAELSDAELVDKWGALKARAKALEADVKLHQDEFEARKLVVVAGQRWGVIRTEERFPMLDIPKIRAAMGREWCAGYSKPGGRTLYKFAEVGGAAPAAAAAPEPRKRRRP